MKTLSVALSLAASLAWAATTLAADPFDDYDDDKAYESCDIYQRKHREAARSLKNLEREEIAPLRQRRERVRREIAYRTKRPVELERKLARLTREASELESKVRIDEQKIESLRRQADELERAGETKKATKARNQAFKGERKNVERLAKAERRNGQGDAFRQEIEELRNAEPSLQELRTTLEQLDLELADVDGILRRRSRHVHFLKRTLDMCQDYRTLTRLN